MLLNGSTHLELETIFFFKSRLIYKLDHCTTMTVVVSGCGKSKESWEEKPQVGFG